MNEISNVLVTVPFPEEQMKKLEQAFAPAKVWILSNKDTEGISKALEHAEVAILNGDLNDQILREGQKLRWIHCDHSGLTYSARQEIFDRGLAVTGAAGRSAPTLAEHAIMFMLSLTYALPELFELQKKHQWGGLPGYNDRRGLIEKTAGIIGVGHAGSELARRLKAFGMNVIGYRRRAQDVEGVDRMYSKDAGDTIAPLLQQSDYLILMTRLNDETYHMIGREELRQMKPGAYLINMCRGSVIDEAALREALETDVIQGAGVDTTEVEPLPADSLLWDVPHLIITPHNTPTVPDRWTRSLQIVLENLELYREGKTLQNQLTQEDLFSRKRPTA